MKQRTLHPREETKTAPEGKGGMPIALPAREGNATTDSR
jgi:hypothetical protein